MLWKYVAMEGYDEVIGMKRRVDGVIYISPSSHCTHADTSYVHD